MDDDAPTLAAAARRLFSSQLSQRMRPWRDTMGLTYHFVRDDDIASIGPGEPEPADAFVFRWGEGLEDVEWDPTIEGELGDSPDPAPLEAQFYDDHYLLVFSPPDGQATRIRYGDVRRWATKRQYWTWFYVDPTSCDQLWDQIIVLLRQYFRDP